MMGKAVEGEGGGIEQGVRAREMGKTRQERGGAHEEISACSLHWSAFGQGSFAGANDTSVFFFSFRFTSVTRPYLQMHT